MKKTFIKITPARLETVWKTKLSPFLKNKVKKFNLSYRLLTEKERDEALLKAVDFITADFVVFAGEHRYNQWEKGWGENLELLKKTGGIDAIVPKYFGKYPINRFDRQLVMPSRADYEVKILSLLQYWIFEKYLSKVPTIYEFGCGTGHNLLRMREVNPGAELWGLDWATASQKIIKKTALALGDTKLHGHHFDYFHPDKTFKLDPQGAIFTFASLEQTGDKYKAFVEYVIKNKPALCVHIEPYGEPLDPTNLLDALSQKYFKKRKYVDGYINHLRELEKQGRVKILNVQRSFIGSFYIDGYSIVVWKPL